MGIDIGRYEEGDNVHLICQWSARDVKIETTVLNVDYGFKLRLEHPYSHDEKSRFVVYDDRKVLASTGDFAETYAESCFLIPVEEASDELSL